jgi:hypothetical protein
VGETDELPPTSASGEGFGTLAIGVTRGRTRVIKVYTCCPELPAFWDRSAFYRRKEVKEPKLQSSG